MNKSEKESFIKSPFDAPWSKYRSLYKSLKVINDKNEAAFIKRMLNEISKREDSNHGYWTAITS